MTASSLEAAAALLTALAACAAFGISLVALKATYEAPKRAAELAEDLRASSQKNEENRRLKLWVFTTLLQHRGSITSPESVSALNLIDVVFIDDAEVRQSWKSFLISTDEQPFYPVKVVERYLTIIEKISRSLGMSNQITVADVQKGYYPIAMGEVAEVEHLERQYKIRSLKGGDPGSQGSGPAPPAPSA